MTEAELVRAAQRGEQDAFAQLVEANQGRIYTLAYRMTGNVETARDLTQETFLSAWQALPRFRGKSAFSTWLYRMAVNACIDFLRREKRRAVLPLSSEDDALQLPDQGPSPQEALEQQERLLALRQALAALSPHHRKVLVLRELEGLSYREIAQYLGLEEGTVKSRIARARLALRDALIATGNFFPPGSV